MVKDINFDDIRPYNDSEVNHHIKLLLEEEKFQNILKFIFQDQQKIKQVMDYLSGINTVKDLQHNFSYNLIEDLILKKSTEGLTSSGIDKLDKNTSYLFISNHRDIVLDSALMNYLILSNGMNTTQIAIGNNLMIEKWIEYAVKLNRSFVVRRNLPVRELLMASKKLSEFIRRDITVENASVWIAQREGRTKDGFDKTQPALLKMLNLSNKSDFVEGFRELRIVPISISYEIEPCGISKVAELYKRQTEGYEKTQDDDLRSMGEGLVRPKGHVHFAFGEPINYKLDEISSLNNLPAMIDKLAEEIDNQIYCNYKLSTFNYIADDLLTESKNNKEQYSDEQLNKFNSMLDEAIKTINGDSKIVSEMFLKMYANPVINKRNTWVANNVH